MKIHLGCGNLYLKDYTNIDINSEKADLNLDINNLQIFNSNKIEEIYICHVLEHVKRDQILQMFLEWNRILKINSYLRLSVPDLKKIIEIYNDYKDLSLICGLIHGGQRNKYDIHYITYDFETLEEILKSTGFYDIQIYNPFEFLSPENDDYSKATIPHMDPSGNIMSLNIICKKKNDVNINEIQLSNKLKKIFKL